MTVYDFQSPIGDVIISYARFTNVYSLLEQSTNNRDVMLIHFQCANLLSAVVSTYLVI